MSAGDVPEKAREIRVDAGVRVIVNPPSGRWVRILAVNVGPVCGGLGLMETTSKAGAAAGACARAVVTRV